MKRENTKMMFESLTGTSGVAYDVKLVVYIGSQHGVSSELWAKCRAQRKHGMTRMCHAKSVAEI